MTKAALNQGLIVANYGRHFLVETPDGTRVICQSRGTKRTGVGGARVQWLPPLAVGTVE